MGTRPSSGKKKGDIWLLDLLQVKRKRHMATRPSSGKKKETYGY